MSRSWKGGSTRRWRRVRAAVLDRDGWLCKLCGHVIDPTLRPPHPQSASVHHLHGKRHGDDPQYLVASHRECNRLAGEPGKAPDLRPRPRTRW